MKQALLGLLLSVTAFGEVHTLTLRQAVDMALAQNPDVVLSRLDAQRSRAQVDVVNQLYSPTTGVGSGIAWTEGIPGTMDGNAPSLFTAKGQMALFDRPMTYRTAATREASRTSELTVALREEEVAYRVASLYLDAENAAQAATAADAEVQNLNRVLELTRLRIEENREIPIAASRASMEVKRATNALARLRYAQAQAEITLAEALGLPPGDQTRPAFEERSQFVVTLTQDEALQRAFDDSREVRQLESQIQAKMLELKSYEAAHLPRVNLFWQYQRLTTLNNFDQFYQNFQPNNAQVGASFEVPLLVGRAVGASKTQAEIDIEKLRTEIGRTRTRLEANVRRAYADLDYATAERDLAREELDFAREQVALDLAAYEEGRILLAQVETSRAVEQARWIEYYDAQKEVEVARLNILRGTGTVLAALR